LLLHSIDELVNGGFTAKEKLCVFLPKVEKLTIWADGGADRSQLLSEVWAWFFPANGFGQNRYAQVLRLGSQIHPGQLTKKAPAEVRSRRVVPV
jgi:hypothetical protein